jgi:hypothetical protein
MPLNLNINTKNIPIVFSGAPGTTAGVFRPVRIGARPYAANRTGKRRPVLVRIDRGSSNGTPNYASDLTLWGADLPNIGVSGRVDSSTGRILPILDTLGADTGVYNETIDVGTGAGTGISFIRVVNGGKGYTSAPTVVFTGGGGASAAATAVVRNGAVVGAYVTNAGTGYTSAPVISFTGGSGSGAAAVTALGQVTTVNTHIPYAAHAPTTDAGAFWAVLINNGQHVLTYDTTLSLTADDGALEPQQHVMGTNANGGFSVATGTHSDGTTTIGVLTLNLGLPNNSVIRVVRTKTLAILAAAKYIGHVSEQRATSLMWVGGGAASDNTVATVSVNPLGE